jgi:ATP-dependent DNA ligase
MKFRYPDDPSRVTADYLAQLERDYPGMWLAQVKGDGWRRPGYLEDGEWKFYSKRGDGNEAAKQPPQDLVDELAGMGWPDGTALDMEWMGPRCVEELQGRHEFWVFDILFHRGRWLGRRVGFADRLALLGEVWAGLAPGPRVRLLEARDRDLTAFYEEQRRDPLSEGLVLRQRDSGLVGSLSKPTKNPAMIKVKYREI